MAGYYRTIKGKKYDRRLLELAEELTSGRGDGRISLEDARRMLARVRDADDYTDIEKLSIRYIRDHFKFTKSADTYFRKEIRRWAAKRGRKSSPTGKESGVRTKKTRALPATPVRKTESRTGRLEIDSKGFFSRLVRRRIFWSIMLLIFFLVLLLFFMRFCQPEADQSAAKDEVNQSRSNPGKQVTPMPALAMQQAIDKSNRELETLQFSFTKNSRSLTAPDLQKRLDRVARILISNPSYKLEVQGHSCSDGIDSVNRRISQERAEIVRNELLKRGIAAHRLLAQGYADSSPVVANNSEANKIRNRRVTFKIL